MRADDAAVPPVAQPPRATTRIALSEFKTIVVAERDRPAPTCLHIAAEELARYLAAMAGTKPVLADNRRVQRGPLLVVGDCDTSRRLVPDLVPQRLGFEEFVVARSRQGDLVFVGQDDTASMFAVFAFLEACGVRWFTPEIEKVPRVEHANLSLPLRERPAFAWRRLGQHLSFSEGPALYPGVSRADLWALHHKLIERCPRYQTHAGWPIDGTHTSAGVITQSKYGKDHPEYFSLVSGTRTVTGKYQPCFSNPSVIGLLAESALSRMRGGPVLIADLSQTDYSTAYCRCDVCAGMAHQTGSESGPLFRAMNAVATVTSRTFPDRYVCSLAYQWSRKPPQALDIHPNVFVWYAPIGRNLLAPLAASERMTDLRGWREKTSNIILWDYMTNFRDYLLPTPNLDVVLEDLRGYEAQQIRGVYLQGAKYEGAICDFMDLRAYVLAKAMWSPGSIPDLRDEAGRFFQAVYGPAAADVQAYFDLIYGLDRSNARMQDLGGVTDLYTRDFLVRSRELLNRAWTAALGTPAQGRVAALRLSVLMAILQHPELADVDEATLHDFMAMHALTGSPILQEYGTSTLSDYDFWEAAKARALNGGFTNLLADGRVTDINGKVPGSLPESFTRILRTGEWRNAAAPRLRGPRHSLTITLPEPRPINTITVAAGKELAYVMLDVEDAGGFSTVYESAVNEGPSGMFGVTFPAKTARRIRCTLDASGFRDLVRIHRINAGLDPAFEGAAVRFRDFGHLLGGTIVADFPIAELARRASSALQPASYLDRPYLESQIAETPRAEPPAALIVEFSIPHGAYYAIEGLPLGLDGSSDSFTIRLFHEPTGVAKNIRWKFNPADLKTFAWSPIYRALLPAGRYQLELRPREKRAGLGGLRVVRYEIPGPREH